MPDQIGVEYLLVWASLAVGPVFAPGPILPALPVTPRGADPYKQISCEASQPSIGRAWMPMGLACQSFALTALAVAVVASWPPPALTSWRQGPRRRAWPGGFRKVRGHPLNIWCRSRGRRDMAASGPWARERLKQAGHVMEARE